mgnify:CR=1 FL=1
MKIKTATGYSWWIEPLDDITNQAIADELFCSNVEEIETNEGKRKRAWPCGSDLIQKLKKAARTSRTTLRYCVYNRRGQGQIRRVPIFEPK